MPIFFFLICKYLYVSKELDKIFLIKFGKNLKKIRKDKGITQSQLAFEADIQISQISRIERGLINTTILNARLIASILEIPISSLFEIEN